MPPTLTLGQEMFSSTMSTCLLYTSGAHLKAAKAGDGHLFVSAQAVRDLVKHCIHRGLGPVSYTQLDVYKRQALFRVRSPLLTESRLMSLPRPT